MLNRARAKEGLGALRRDQGLDRVARAHAKAMITAGRVAHEAGDGTPSERVHAALVPAIRVGENVASAPTVRRVHQALWNSPSHRANMLDSTFDRVGVALVASTGGKLWAVQLFAR
ncbi:MAG: CAP domain-containing protein [Deltaproteobacteria bacterium]|nr:CAP domain-containing protein [Deltaproteobacteria bacterium]